jgi:hypothetical protein
MITYKKEDLWVYEITMMAMAMDLGKELEMVMMKRRGQTWILEMD